MIYLLYRGEEFDKTFGIEEIDFKLIQTNLYQPWRNS